MGDLIQRALVSRNRVAEMIAQPRERCRLSNPFADGWPVFSDERLFTHRDTFFEVFDEKKPAENEEKRNLWDRKSKRLGMRLKRDKWRSSGVTRRTKRGGTDPPREIESEMERGAGGTRREAGEVFESRWEMRQIRQRLSSFPRIRKERYWGSLWYRNRPQAVRFARLLARIRRWREEKTSSGNSYVAWTCIFFGHGHETLRASRGNVCLENVPRLPERHLQEREFRGLDARAPAKERNLSMNGYSRAERLLQSDI